MPAVHPTWFDWITVAAIVLGPILALTAQRILDRLREARRERRQLYFTLMSTRNNVYSPAHLQALNSIDIVFKDSHRIRTAWKAVLDQVSTSVDESDQEKLDAWNKRILDLRVDLYQAIGDELGFQTTTDYIVRGIYSPRFVSDIEKELHELRRGLVRVLKDDYLPVKVVGVANDGSGSKHPATEVVRRKL